MLTCTYVYSFTHKTDSALFNFLFCEILVCLVRTNHTDTVFEKQLNKNTCKSYKLLWNFCLENDLN